MTALTAAWTALVALMSRFWVWLDARARAEARRTELAVETRAAERTEREAERDASQEAHADPGRDAVARRLRDGKF